MSKAFKVAGHQWYLLIRHRVVCLSEVVCEFPRHVLRWRGFFLVSGEHIYVTVSVNRLNFTHPETNIIFKINEYKSIYHLFLFSSPEEKNYAFFIHQAISEFQKPLTFSTRLSAKPFLCKWVVFAWESKIIFMSITSHFAPRFETEAWGNSGMA